MAFTNPAVEEMYGCAAGVGGGGSAADSHPNISLPLGANGNAEDAAVSGPVYGHGIDPNASSNSINSLGASSKLPSLKDDFDSLNTKFEQARVRQSLPLRLVSHSLHTVNIDLLCFTDRYDTESMALQ